jgi:hypothetical protein
MNDAYNIDIEDVQQLAPAQSQEEQQQQQAIFFLKKMILVLEQKETFPLRTRNKTEELVETFLIEAAQQDEQQQQQHQQANVLLKKLILVLQYRETFPLRTGNQTDELVEKFLAELGKDVHNMLCDSNTTDIDSDNYRGLDSERDTEAEVEAIVRIFPEVLTRKKPCGPEDYYPIQLLTFALDEYHFQCNVKTVSFIPIVARIAIEFDLFEEEERGGLLSIHDQSCNVLVQLMACDPIHVHHQEYHESVDTKYLQVLIRLRQLDLLKKEDIQSYDLLHRLSREDHDYTPKKRYKMLVEWDPNALTQTCDRYGQLPLNKASVYCSIQGFQFVFEYGIRYFPKKKGISLLFKKNNYDGYVGARRESLWNDLPGHCTPFQYACKKFGREEVTEAVEDTLIRCYSSSSDDTPPLHVVNALMTAAIDANIHLDCVYFLMRRKPDVLMEVLSPLPYISKLRKRKRNDHH